MKPFHCSASLVLNLSIMLALLLFAATTETTFPALNLARTQVAEGEIWRLFSANFVHFGWPHTLMNLAAFALCALALLNNFPLRQLLGLIIFCCLSVGVGVYYLNPEYLSYAGLSGAIHGFIVAGLMRNQRHPNWLNALCIAALFGKIIYEHQADYQATQLQNLLPVAVAYDAHLYGAIAGLVFGFGQKLCSYWRATNADKAFTHQP